VTIVEQSLGQRMAHPAHSDDRYLHALLPFLCRSDPARTS
jgi:hypothetical protein